MERGQMSNKALTWAVIGLIILAAGGLIWTLSSPSQQAIVSGGGTQLSPSGGADAGTVVQGFCPSTGLTTLSVFGIESVKTTQGTEVQVGSNLGVVYVYRNGETQAYDTIVLSNTSQVASTSGKELSCGADRVLLIAGNDTNPTAGTGTYYESLDLGTIPKTAQISKGFKLDQMGGLTLSLSNGTNLDATTQNISIAAGATNVKIKLTISENSGNVVRTPTVFTNYSTTAFQEVKPTNGVAIDSIPTRLSLYEAGYTIGVDKLVNYGETTVTIAITSKSGQESGQISIVVADVGTYIKDGQLLSGYEDASDNNIGASDPTAVNIFVD